MLTDVISDDTLAPFHPWVFDTILVAYALNLVVGFFERFSNGVQILTAGNHLSNLLYLPLIPLIGVN
jgi:hypothetical protein